MWTALVTVYVIWGSTYLGIAVTGETIPPLFAASTRFIAAGSLMVLVVLLRRGQLRVSRRALGSCILIGILLPGANAVLFFAERNVPTGLASLIIASVPLWVVVLRLAGRERLPWQALAGVGVGFAGVAVLAQPSGGATYSGIALCVLSAIMWSVGSVLSARVTMPDDPFAATAYEMLAGGLVMLPIAVFTVHDFSPSTASILGWIYLVTFGSIVGYTAYVWLLANAPLGLVSTYAYVNPVVAIALGVRVPRRAADLATALRRRDRRRRRRDRRAAGAAFGDAARGGRALAWRDGRADRRARARGERPPGIAGAVVPAAVDLGGRGEREAQMEPGGYSKDGLVGTLVVVSLDDEPILLAARSHAHGPVLLRPDADVEPGTIVA